VEEETRRQKGTRGVIATITHRRPVALHRALRPPQRRSGYEKPPVAFHLIHAREMRGRMSVDYSCVKRRRKRRRRRRRRSRKQR